MNPYTINPLTLPSLPLAERRNLPSVCAIYFALSSYGEVLYIAKATSLVQRWAAHHRYSQLKNMENVRLAWLECSDTSLLTEIEEALINWFSPPINGSAVVGDKKRISLYVEERLKIELEALAKSRRRSLSNLIEVLCEEAVEKAKQEGEIK